MTLIGSYARSHKRSLATWTIVGGSLIPLSHLYYWVTLLIPLMVLASVLFLLWAGYHGLSRRRTDWKYRVFGGTLGFVLCVALAPLILQGQRALMARSRHAMAEVAEALERYRSDRGIYPEELSALVPRYLKESPTCPGSPFIATMIYSRPDEAETSHSLTCYTVVFRKLTYDSRTRRWRTWD